MVRDLHMGSNWRVSLTSTLGGECRKFLGRGRSWTTMQLQQRPLMVPWMVCSWDGYAELLFLETREWDLPWSLHWPVNEYRLLARAGCDLGGRGSLQLRVITRQGLSYEPASAINPVAGGMRVSVLRGIWAEHFSMHNSSQPCPGPAQFLANQLWNTLSFTLNEESKFYS